MSKLHVNDVNAQLRLNFVDEFGASVDVRSSTTEEIFARKPSDARVTFTAGVATPAACAITRVNTTATVVLADHGLATGQVVEIAGAAEGDYNGDFTVTVVDTDTFTYTVTGSPATPATGAPTARPINRIFYDTQSNDIDEAGMWDVQGHVVLPSGEDWASDIERITVEPRLG